MGSPPALLLVNGAPASGKSTVAAALGVALGIGIVAKDPIKERLYDEAPAAERDGLGASRAFGALAIATMFAEARARLDRGESVIVDCNLRPEFDEARIHAWCAAGACRAAQVLVAASPDVLLRRHRQRDRTRHPAHLDAEHLVADASLLRDWPPLAVAPAFYLDTTDGMAGLAGLVLDLRGWLSLH